MNIFFSLVLIFILSFGVVWVSYGENDYTISNQTKINKSENIYIKKLNSSKNIISKLSKWKQYIEILDQFIEKYENSQKILNKIYTRIWEIKSKINNKNKLAILGYLEASIWLKLYNLENSELIKNYWDWFSVKQNDDITYVDYNWKIIMELKNEIGSFDKWEQCDFFNKCEHYNTEWNYDLETLKEKLKNKYNIEKIINNNIFIINIMYYEWWTSYLYDTNNNKLVKTDFWISKIKLITKIDNNYILEISNYYKSIIKLNNNFESEVIYYDSDWYNDIYMYLEKYELIWTNKLKLFYNEWYNTTIKEKNINLD